MVAPTHARKLMADPIDYQTASAGGLAKALAARQVSAKAKHRIHGVSSQTAGPSDTRGTAPPGT